VSFGASDPAKDVAKNDLNFFTLINETNKTYIK
jgi:hypothetical protein